MKKLLLITCCLAIAAAVQAHIIPVPAGYSCIQKAMDMADNGDTILVSPGLYKENINFYGKNITVASFFLTTGDTAYITQTVLDGNSSGSVVTFQNTKSLYPVLCGFTVTNGYGNFGGGISIFGSSPTLNHVLIKGNSAVYGGGIYCIYSSLNLSNSVISGNSCSIEGGAIYLENASSILFNIEISGNTSDQSGGGLYFLSSTPVLTNLIIKGNAAIDHGGGIYSMSSDPLLQNVLVAENTAGHYGGGIFGYGGGLSLSNLTVSKNTAGNSGGGFYSFNTSKAKFVNSIIWDNIPEGIYGSAQAEYCDIQGGWPGSYNLVINPSFQGNGEHPYALSNCSHCIDAGTLDTTGLNLPGTDILGNIRIWDGDTNGIAVIDLGAYEYGSMLLGLQEPESGIRGPGFGIYPNPFLHSTMVEYDLVKNCEVSLIILDQLGQVVKVLVNERQACGKYQVQWEAGDLPGGIYYMRLMEGYHLSASKIIKL